MPTFLLSQPGIVAAEVITPNERPWVLHLDHHADGGNNNCDSITNFDVSDKMWFSEISPKATDSPKHHLDVMVIFQIPGGYIRPDTGEDMLVIDYKTTGNGGVEVVKIVDSDGTEQTSGFPARASSASLAQIAVPESSITGTFTPKSIVKVFIRGDGDSGDVAFIGDIDLRSAV